MASYNRNQNVGLELAIGINEEQTQKNINDSLKRLEKQIGVKFEPKSFEIVKFTTEGIEFVIRDTQNIIYKFYQDLHRLGQDYKFGEDFTISTKSFDKTEAKLIQLSKVAQNLQDKLDKLGSADTTIDTSQADSNLKTIINEINDIAISQEGLTKSAENSINERIALTKKEIEALAQLNKEQQENAKLEESRTRRFGQISNRSLSITGDGINAESIRAVTDALKAHKSAFRSASTVYDISGQAWTKYEYQLKNADGTIKKLNLSINRNTGEVRENAKIVNSNNIHTAKWLDRLKIKLSDVTTYLSATTIIYTFFNQLSKGVRIIKDIDSAMTELKKVTDETEASYNKFLQTASQMSVAVGRSIPDVITATAEFSKLGYTLEEATALAEKALILTNIGDGIQLDTSIESIVSALKGFELDKTALDVMENSQRITDAINEVSNNFAVSVQDISTAITQMSAVMNQTGTTLEETIGMFTAGQEIMQDASKVSNGLITIAQRLRGISDEGEDLSNLIPTLEKQFNAMGLTLLDQNGELKSTYHILNDLSTVWDDQSSQVKQYVGELIAGKRQISVLYSTLQGWSQAQEATTSALQSTGSAMRENEKYLDSIHGKIHQFNTAVEAMWLNSLHSEDIKLFVEFGTHIVKLVDNLGLVRIAVSALMTALIMHSGVLGEIRNQYRNLRTEQAGAITGQIKLATAVKATTQTLKEMGIVAKIAQSAVTFIASYALQFLASTIVKLVRSTESLEDKIDRANELIQIFRDNIHRIDENQKRIENLADDFTRLSQGVDDYGRNIALTTEEHSSYKKIVEELIAINPAIIKGWNAEGEAIIDKNTALKETIELLERERELELEKATSTANLTTIAEGATADISKLIGNSSVHGWQKPDLKTIAGQATRFAKEAVKIFNEESIKAFYDYTPSRPLQKIYGSNLLQFLGLEEKDLDIAGYLALNIDVFAKNMEDILRKANIDPNSEQARNLKLYVKEWQTLRRELDNIGKSYLDEPLQQIAQLADGYENLTDKHKAFLSDVIRNSFSAYDLQYDAVGVKTAIIDMVDSIATDVELQNTIDRLFSLDSSKLSAEKYVEQYKKAVDTIIEQLDLSDNVVRKVKTHLEIEISDVESLQQQVQNKLGELGFVDDGFVENLSLDDLKVYYKIVASEDSDFESFEATKQEYSRFKAELESQPTQIKLEITDESVDDFQKNIDTIEKALSNLNNIKPSEILDLMQQFPQLSQFGFTGSEGIEALESALKNLIISLYDNLDESLKNVTVIQQIRDTALDATDSVLSLSTALSNVNNSGKLLADVKEEFKESGYISSDTLAKIASQSPKLEAVVAKFNAGLADTTDVLDALGEAYNKDIENYKTAVIEKNKLDTEFYTVVINNLSEDIKERATAYGIDLEKYKNLQIAKLELDKEYALKKKALQEQSDKVASGANGGVTIKDYSAQMREYFEAIQDLAEFEQFIEDFNTNIKINIGSALNFDGYKPKLNQSKKKSDPVWLKEFERLKADLEHRLAMDKITEKKYYDELEKLTNKYLKKHKKTHLELYRQNIEEIYRGRKKLNENAIKAIFDDLKYSFDIDKISEEEYYVKLGKLNDKYYKNVKKYQDEYRSNLLAIYRWELQQEEKRIENIVNSYQREIDIVNNKKQNIQNAISEIEALNGQASKQQYQDLIALTNKEIGYYTRRKASATNALKTVKKNSEAYYSLLEAIQSCDDAISQAEKSQYEWNRAILQMPIARLEKQNEAIRDTIELLSDEMNRYNKVISAVTGAIDEQIDAYNEQKKLINDEDVFGSYAYRIKLIQDEIEGLREVNEQHKKEMELQQAKYNAERARNQKTKRVYREGIGFVYEADQEAIRTAQHKLDELTFNSLIDSKQKVLKDLEKEKELALKAFDKQIEKLNVIKKQWTDIADTFDRIANLQLAESILGVAWRDKVLSGDTASLNYIKSKYMNVQGEMSDLEARIKANDEEIESLQKLIKAWEETQLSIKEQKERIKKTVTDNSKELKALEKLQESVTEYAIGWSDAKESINDAQTDINDAHDVAKDNELEIINERIANLQYFKEEVQSIAGNISSALSRILSDLNTAKKANSELANLSDRNGKTSKSNVNVAGKSHRGMELGYVGSNAHDRDLFRYIALDKLQPNEVVRVLEKREAVLTTAQQGNILANIGNAYRAGIQSIVSKISNKSMNAQPSFSVGEIHLHEVNNVDGLASAIVRDFLPTMSQKLYH